MQKVNFHIFQNNFFFFYLNQFIYFQNQTNKQKSSNIYISSGKLQYLSQIICLKKDSRIIKSVSFYQKNMTTKNVYSPFIHQDNQLFYHASFSVQLKTITLKVYNQKGIQKNTRNFNIPKYVEDIFATDKYLIGLDKDHLKICIIDTVKYRDKSVDGIVPKQQRNQNPKKFTKFIYDSNLNLILGLLEDKQIYYFSIKKFNQSIMFGSRIDGGIRSDIDFSNSNLLIEKIYTSNEVINKLEIRCTKVYNKVYKENPQKQFQPKVLSYIQDFKESEEQLQPEVVYKICLLIKQKKLMRSLEIDWDRDKVEKKQQTPNVFDFCFRNGWDLIIYIRDSAKNRNKNLRSDKTECQITTKCRGQYTGIKLLLSGQQTIFSSKEAFFIVDRECQTIAGIHQNQYRQISQCTSIPQKMTLQNTLLIIQRCDKANARFLFQKFDPIKQAFQYTPILISLYQIHDQGKNQLFLQKNLQKIFTINGLIHPSFTQKVQSWVNNFMQNVMVNNNHSRLHQSNSRMSQSNVNQSRIFIKQNMQPHDLASKFLQYFVFSNSFYINRLINHIINSYGLELLFKNFPSLKAQKCSEPQKKANVGTSQLKLSHHPKAFQSQIRSKIKGTQTGHLFAQTQSKIGSKIKTIKPQQILQLHIKDCNFDRWNKYLQQMIYQSIQLIRKSFQLSTNQDLDQLLNQNKYQNNQNSSSKISQPSSPYKSFHRIQQNLPNNKCKDFFQRISKQKQKLSTIQNIYNRFLKQINDKNLLLSTNALHQFNEQKIAQYNQLVQNLEKYHKTIFQNINKCQSLFLIYNLFNMVKKDNFFSQEAYRNFIKIVEQKFRNFSKERKRNIEFMKPFVKNSLSSLCQQEDNQFSVPFLMFHEHFEKARVLIYSSEVDYLSFGEILDYFLFNIDKFEQIAFFYFVLAEQVQKQGLVDSRIENRKKQANRKSYIFQSAIYHKSQQQNPQKYAIYPYMNKDLIQFFNLIKKIPTNPFVQFNRQEIIQNSKQLILKACDTLLKLKHIPHSFIKYMVQLCGTYDLSYPVIKLISSIRIEQYILIQQTQEKIIQVKNQPNKPSQLQTRKSVSISQVFGQNEKFFIKVILILVGNKYNLLEQPVNSAENYKNRLMNVSRKELLLFYVKRILEIYSRVNKIERKYSQRNISKSTLPSRKLSTQMNKSTRHNIHQTDYPKQSSIYQRQPPTPRSPVSKLHVPQTLSLSCQIKQQLLQQLIKLLFASQQSLEVSIIFLNDLKNEILTSQKDKKIVEEFVQYYIKLNKKKSKIGEKNSEEIMERKLFNQIENLGLINNI